jgi:hypothetical protein
VHLLVVCCKFLHYVFLDLNAYDYQAKSRNCEVPCRILWSSCSIDSVSGRHSHQQFFSPQNNLFHISTKMWSSVFWQILYFSFCVYRQDVEIFLRYKWTLWQFKIYFFSSTRVLLLCMSGLNANIISVFQWIQNSVKVWFIHKTAVVCNDIRCLIVFVVFRTRFELLNSITWPLEGAMASFELCQLWPVST